MGFQVSSNSGLLQTSLSSSRGVCCVLLGRSVYWQWSSAPVFVWGWLRGDSGAWNAHELSICCPQLCRTRSLFLPCLLMAANCDYMSCPASGTWHLKASIDRVLQFYKDADLARWIKSHMLQMLFSQQSHQKSRWASPWVYQICLDHLATAFGSVAENSFPERRADASHVLPCNSKSSSIQATFPFLMTPPVPPCPEVRKLEKKPGQVLHCHYQCWVSKPPYPTACRGWETVLCPWSRSGVPNH